MHVIMHLCMYACIHVSVCVSVCMYSLKPNPWQTSLQPGEPSTQLPMSQSAQCGPDSGAAQPASAPGGAAQLTELEPGSSAAQPTGLTVGFYHV